MFTSARPWRISAIAGLLFLVISFVASAINVQPPQYNPDAAEIGALFEALVASKTLVWFEESGHEPFVDEPVKFNAAMVEMVRPAARVAQ